MAFHDVQLDPEISRDARRVTSRVTQRFKSRSGRVWRNSTVADSTREYDIGYGLRSMSEVRAVVSFWEARQGGLHSFRFRDWSEFKRTNQPLGVGDGTNREFRIVATYGDAIRTWTRRNLAPVAATVVPKRDSVATTAFSLASIDGRPLRLIFDVAPAAGVAITVDFEFDVPVFFAEDDLEDVVRVFEVGEVPSIRVAEDLLS